MECRNDEDVDVKQYMERKLIEIIQFSLSNQMNEIRNQFFKVVSPILDYLVQQGHFFRRDPEKVTFRVLYLAAKNLGQPKTPTDYTVRAQFGALRSLYYTYDLLMCHGLEAFKNALLEFHKKELKKKVNFPFLE